MITSCRGSIELTLIVQRGLRKKSWLPRPPQTPWTMGVSLYSERPAARENPLNEVPQVAAGENPLWKKFLNLSANLAERGDGLSQGREMTLEWGIKLGAGTRLSLRRLDNPASEITYAARWGIAASPAALSFIKGRARAKAPYQQDRTLAVAQPPKTSVVLRDSGGLTSNRKRHAPIRGEGTSEVG